MVTRYMKRSSTSLNIEKCKSRPQWAHHLTPVRMTYYQKITSISEDMEKWESLYTDGENVNWHNHYGIWYGNS